MILKNPNLVQDFVQEQHMNSEVQEQDFVYDSVLSRPHSKQFDNGNLPKCPNDSDLGMMKYY